MFLLSVCILSGKHERSNSCPGLIIPCSYVRLQLFFTRRSWMASRLNHGEGHFSTLCTPSPFPTRNFLLGCMVMVSAFPRTPEEAGFQSTPACRAQMSGLLSSPGRTSLPGRIAASFGLTLEVAHSFCDPRKPIREGLRTDHGDCTRFGRSIWQRSASAGGLREGKRRPNSKDQHRWVSSR